MPIRISAIDLRQLLWSLILVAPLLVVSAVPWQTDRTATLAAVNPDGAADADPCCAPQLTVVERFCWKDPDEIEAESECRFALLNEGPARVRLKAGSQNRLAVTQVPSEIAPGEVAFVTANCQGRTGRGSKPWIGRVVLFTSDPKAPTVSLYAIEGRPSGQLP